MNKLDLFDLKGKTAIITGGAKGIGRASAIMLSEYGANIVIADMDEEAAKETAKNITSNNGKAVWIKCNVTNDDDLLQLIDCAIENFKGIDILVNNVGIGGGGRENPYEMELKRFRQVYEANVFSTWRLCQLVAPHMEKSGYGSIINISSMASINKSPSMSAYASSKAAINHMTANLAHDYGKAGIRVNAVAPGAIRTDALNKVLTPEIETKMLAHTPIKRLGEAEDIAGAVLYFASPISQWVSGQTLFVNGGGEQTLE